MLFCRKALAAFSGLSGPVCLPVDSDADGRVKRDLSLYAMNDAQIVADISATQTGSVTTAVVPAAGFGTRLRPLTDAIPKEMLPVGRRLALERIVEELSAAGLHRVIFVLSPAKEPLIRRYFGDGANGVLFEYALQPEMRGLGDAVLQAESYISANEPFVVALGDAVFEEKTTGGLTRRLIESFTQANAQIGLAVQRVAPERISRYGVVKLAPGADALASFLPIVDIVEKPTPQDAPSEFAAAARYVAVPTVFTVLRATVPGKNGEVQLTDALRTQLTQGLGGIAVPLQNEVRHDIGGLDSYFRAFAAFALRDEEQGPGLRAYLAEYLAKEN